MRGLWWYLPGHRRAGDGKSETALEAERVLSEAFGTRGYAFLLPTMATSDQMYGRVADALLRQSGQDAGLTLVHSMAWLNSAYADDDLDTGSVLTCDGDEAGQGSDRAEADLRPQRWLRGAKRPLLAQFSVGTIDQALMAVLPVRHNALRLLALSGKTFIVDEAHAYDPYMQVLLGRLLNWLGAYGVPVVLLSATLPASVSDRLIKEYLQGAGHKSRDLQRRTLPAPYPGWLYVDAASGRATSISAVRQQEQARARSMDLEVVVEPVVHGFGGGARDRLAVIERILEPLNGARGGTALVVCNTVGDAQDTYLRLRERFDERSHEQGGSVQLLHARFPGDVRETRTREVTEGLGRTGPRPVRRIVVATQVVEQSLDLDADLVVSDLAPLSLLLQRAGRCWRHETHWARHGYPGGRGRPAWARGPRLVVLDPVADGGTVPRRRGGHRHRPEGRRPHRNTPASAGRLRRERGRPRPRPNHPHVGGEDSSGTPFYYGYGGTPPRRWGGLVPGVQPRPVERNTPRRRGGLRHRQGHPRRRRNTPASAGRTPATGPP
ncbi:CRISPR-associated helicase Cas3' [Streptomyces rochei]|uniref:CRISPR-associated helicase Cas3' n=1 Tax=Streptomyces rochei TaxID=1928 RepID=UPI0037BDFA2A